MEGHADSPGDIELGDSSSTEQQQTSPDHVSVPLLDSPADAPLSPSVQSKWPLLFPISCMLLYCCLMFVTLLSYSPATPYPPPSLNITIHIEDLRPQLKDIEPYVSSILAALCLAHFNTILQLLVLDFRVFVKYAGIVIVVLTGALLCPIVVLLLPMLVLCFLAARLFQAISHGVAYDYVIVFRRSIHTLIFYLYAFSILPALAMAWFSPTLDVLLLPEKRWDLICIGAVSFVLKLSSSYFNFIQVVQLSHLESGADIREALLEIFECLHVLLLISLTPSKKLTQDDPFNSVLYDHVLGLEIKEWILALLGIFFVNNIITIYTNTLVWSLQQLATELDSQTHTNPWRYSILHIILSRKNLAYRGNGVKCYINIILSSLVSLIDLDLLLFTTKQEYETLEIILNQDLVPRKISEMKMWTGLSLLICAFLCLIKTWYMLSREADSIYVRLESKILQGRKQLYFLGVLGRHNFDIFNLLYQDETPKLHLDGGLKQFFILLKRVVASELMINLNTEYHCKTDTLDELENEKKLSKKLKKRVKDCLLMPADPSPTTFYIQQIALYFLKAKNMLSEEKYTSNILEKLQSYNQDVDNRDITEILKRLIGEEDWNDFQHQLDEYVGSSEAISFETRLEAWMKMAHNNCLSVANSLSRAKEVVNRLDKIISWVLYIATVKMWLYLTGLATSSTLKKLAIVYATTVLVVSIFFRDACKTLFQGIIFVYVAHPFDVGDLCIIDEKMLEVKTIGVWKTTFFKY